MRDCSCHREGLIEVKCSYKHRDLNVQEIQTLDSNVCLQGDKLELKKPHIYYIKVQFQMHVNGKKFSDLVMYTE